MYKFIESAVLGLAVIFRVDAVLLERVCQMEHDPGFGQSQDVTMGTQDLLKHG